MTQDPPNNEDHYLLGQINRAGESEEKSKPRMLNFDSFNDNNNTNNDNNNSNKDGGGGSSPPAVKGLSLSQLQAMLTPPNTKNKPLPLSVSAGINSRKGSVSGTGAGLSGVSDPSSSGVEGDEGELKEGQKSTKVTWVPSSSKQGSNNNSGSNSGNVSTSNSNNNSRRGSIITGGLPPLSASSSPSSKWLTREIL